MQKPELRADELEYMFTEIYRATERAPTQSRPLEARVPLTELFERLQHIRDLCRMNIKYLERFK